MKRTLCIVLGFLSLALGVLGIFLPLLPTTPFLLLSAWLWIRSSNRLYQWLLSNPYLGKYIRDYMEKKQVPWKVKVVTLVLLWASMLFCIFCVLPGRLHFQLLLLAIAIGVSWHVVRLGQHR